ncbi:MAG TPA: nucleotide exchange factor GrpE [Candidatus Paceibacterota bacterium]|nr:nucleotide exchange factor GrpE [Verrucomicrobiota bacterium]HSA11394.1 nucleotide exchange factor GrpE [Candidatus Paceibacterota bacterium]
MSDSIAPKLSKWPFLLGDALLLGMAFFIAWQCNFALGRWEMAFVVLCVAGGAVLGIVPFLIEYDALIKVTEANALTSVVSQLKDLEGIAAQISGATSRWQDAQDAADKTSRAAGEIAERLTTEARAFTEFMQRANDSERANLRLEVEKLRRAESEWLQVLVRVLDHVYALHLGAVRSGQPNLIEQLGNFQNACRDAARRIGLTPFTASESEPFDARRHQRAGNGAPPPADAVIAETLATGYTFQGQLLRPALVRLRGEAAPGAPGTPNVQDGQQSSLPLDASESKSP